MNPARGVVCLFAALAATLTVAPAVALAAEVSGTVFDDRNADGEFRAPEPGLAGWVVYIDADADGVLDNPSGPGTCTAQATEPCATTDANGTFRFSALPAGAVQLRIVPQPGWSRTTEAAVDVLLPNDDSVVSGVLFGVFRLGIATGTVFEDLDGDAIFDAGEPPLSGWTLFVDADLNDQLGPGEFTDESGADGVYALDGLTLGVHALRVRNRCGFIQTLPPQPTLRYVVTITKSGQIVPGRDFGLQRPSLIPGDGNGDGVVTAADLIGVIQAIGRFPVTGADANQDGGVNAADVPATVTNVFDCAGIAAAPVAPMATATATTTAIESPTAGGATPTASATEPEPSPTMTGAATATSSATALSTASTTATRSPNATPTVTSTTAVTATITRTPTLTSAPTPDAAALAGTAAQIANGMNAIPAVITALVSGIKFGALVYDPDAQLSGIGGPAGACPLSGTATRTCVNGSGQGTLSVAFDNCRIPTASGSVTIDELPPTDPAVALHGGVCIGNVALPPWTATIGVSAVFRDTQGAQLLTATAALTGTITPSIGGSCSASGATLAISGTIRTQFADGSTTSLTFTNTNVVVAVATFNAQCVPVKYTMTFNGPGVVAVSAPPALARGAITETSTAVVFSNFVVAQNATGSPTLTDLDGGLGAACAGAQLTLDTTESLAQAVGAQCPTDGTLKITSGGTTAQLFYLNGGAVGVDANNDNVAESQLDSCRDAPPLCAGGAATPTVTRTPAATATRTSTGTVTSTVTPGVAPTSTATRTVTNTVAVAPSATATPTPTATIAPAQQFCSGLPGPVAIPDFNATGLTNTIVVQSAQTLADLNVSLLVAHTWVGDLRVTLTHVDTGKSILLLENPGRPATTTGCGLDNIDAVFDDASLRAAQDRCAAGPLLAAAIDGSVAPKQALSVFNGDSLNGTWRLNVADLATQDTGSLIDWCLIPNSPNPVVTTFTCDAGGTECVQVVDDPFQLSFSYADPNGDAATWHITGRREDGFVFEGGNGSLASGSSGTVTLDFTEFTCPTQDCPDTDFDYFLTVTDSAGHDSPIQRLRVLFTLIGL